MTKIVMVLLHLFVLGLLRTTAESNVILDGKDYQWGTLLHEHCGNTSIIIRVKSGNIAISTNVEPYYDGESTVWNCGQDVRATWQCTFTENRGPKKSKPVSMIKFTGKLGIDIAKKWFQLTQSGFDFNNIFLMYSKYPFTTRFNGLQPNTLKMPVIVALNDKEIVCYNFYREKSLTGVPLIKTDQRWQILKDKVVTFQLGWVQIPSYSEYIGIFYKEGLDIKTKWLQDVNPPTNKRIVCLAQSITRSLLGSQFRNAFVLEAQNEYISKQSDWVIVNLVDNASKFIEVQVWQTHKDWNLKNPNKKFKLEHSSNARHSAGYEIELKGMSLVPGYNLLQNIHLRTGNVPKDHIHDCIALFHWTQVSGNFCIF